MPNVGGWYKRKWKAYTPTEDEAKFGWIELLAILILITLIIILLKSITG